MTTLYLAVALAAPFVLNQPQPSGWMVIASYLFIPVMRADGLVQPVYSLGWTLNYEMFFYVLFAAVIVLPIRSAMVSLLALLAALALLGTFRLPPTLAFWTDPIILEFAFGAALGWLQSRGVTLSRWWRWALVVLGLGLLAAVGSKPGAVPLMRPLLWGLPVAMLVAAAALREDRTWAASLFTRFCAFLGRHLLRHLPHPPFRDPRRRGSRREIGTGSDPGTGRIYHGGSGGHGGGGVPDLPGVRKTCDGVFAAEAGTRRYLAAGWSVLPERQAFPAARSHPQAAARAFLP